jgi:hypothetical protein
MVEKGVVLKAVAELQASVAELRGKRGILEILKAVPAVVRKVEEVGKDLDIKGAEKKELALDILFALLPPLPWYLPEFVLRKYAGILIEKAVSALKARFSKS